MIAHAGHDHGLHHWLPSLICAAVVVTIALVALRARQEDAS